MSVIETLSPPQPVSMANEWFQFATADHFWMQWRHHLIVRAVKRSGAVLQRALEVGCGLGLPGIVALSMGLQVTFSDYDACALRFAADEARLALRLATENLESFKLAEITEPAKG